MKSATSCLFILLSLCSLRSQSFYNGSFELHSFDSCVPIVYDTLFNLKMTHVKAFGRTYAPGLSHLGKISIQDSGCSVVPQQGNWCIGLHSTFTTSSDAVALELTSTLNPGQVYQLSFYVYGNVGFHNYQSSISIGESLDSISAGNYLYSAMPVYLNWTNITFTFTASQSSKYITAKIAPGYNSWAQLDNFLITSYPTPLGLVEESESDFFQVFPNPGNRELRIQFANDPEPSLVELSDQLGRTVRERRIVHTQLTSIDVSALSPGVYYLRVSNGRATARKKILISR